VAGLVDERRQGTAREALQPGLPGVAAADLERRHPQAVAALVGQVLGDKWNTDPRMHQFFHDFHLLFGAVFVAAGAWYIWHRLKTRIGKDKRQL
jgi:hypothetical protein